MKDLTLNAKRDGGKPFLIIFICAITVLIVLLAVWSCVYTVRSLVDLSGLSGENTVICYVDAKTAAGLSEGMTVTISGAGGGTVSFIASTPLSKGEVIAELPESYVDYTAATLNISEWNYKVIISSDKPLTAGKLVSLSILKSAKRPIDYLFK